jgi:uncharacterized protein
MGAVRQLVQRAREVRAASAPDVPSPCVSICRMDPRTQWCEGCYRTLDEIAAWSRMDDEQKREVWRMIAKRALAPNTALSPAPPQREREREK